MKCKVRGRTGTSNTCVNGTFKPYEVHKGVARSVEMQAWIEKHKEQIKRQIRRWLKEKHHDK